jgi:pimeloyl-ACP methyl ester carboxylesterase
MAGERMVVANGVDLCVQTFGDAADRAILLVHGASASMLWWERGLCERIAAGGRHVIRFDHRDTGRSVSYPPGRPEYSLADMADDAIGILDALAIGRAHVVGMSMAGGIVALVAARFPDRVLSLTLVATSPGGDDLPPMSEEVSGSPASPNPDDPAAVIDFVAGIAKVYSGGSPYHDERATRALVEQDVARTANIASCLTNHYVIDVGEPVRLEEIRAPTLVVHGELDPVFPLPHGRALQARIPGASLLVLRDAGHELPPPVWDVFVPALIAHTASA